MGAFVLCRLIPGTSCVIAPPSMLFGAYIITKSKWNFFQMPWCVDNQRRGQKHNCKNNKLPKKKKQKTKNKKKHVLRHRILFSWTHIAKSKKSGQISSSTWHRSQLLFLLRFIHKQSKKKKNKATKTLIKIIHFQFKKSLVQRGLAWHCISLCRSRFHWCMNRSQLLLLLRLLHEHRGSAQWIERLRKSVPCGIVCDAKHFDGWSVSCGWLGTCTWLW